MSLLITTSAEAAYATKDNILHPQAERHTADGDLRAAAAQALAEGEIEDRLGELWAGGSSDAPPIVATTRAGLGTPTEDGRLGIVKVGAGQNTTMVFFIWDLAGSKWVQEEFPVVWSADTTPILLPSAFQTKQYMGDPNNGSHWGTSPPRFVGALYAAGFNLEYRHEGFLQRNATGIGPPENPDAGEAINVGTYFYQLNSGDVTVAETTPPTAGAAETAYLNGGSATLGHSAYRWHGAGWAALPLLAGNPTKDILYAVVHGFMDAPAASSGSMVDYALFLRWVG